MKLTKPVPLICICLFLGILFLFSCEKEDPVFIHKSSIHFSFEKDELCGKINFTDKTSQNPTYWLWEFGDREKSTDQNPEHTYKSNGKFIVKLSVSTDNKHYEKTNPAYRTDTVVIDCYPPIAGFDMVKLGQSLTMKLASIVDVVIFHNGCLQSGFGNLEMVTQATKSIHSIGMKKKENTRFL